MRTRITIDAALLERARILTGKKSRSAAMHQVLDEWLRRQQVQELRNLRGKLHVEDAWKELRELEKRKP